MDLIVSPSIFESYINGTFKSPKDEYDNDVNTLINNPNNRFVLSKDFLEYLENLFSQSPLSSIIQPLLSNVINYQSITVTPTNAKTKDDILKSLVKAYDNLGNNNKKDVSIIISDGNEINYTNSIDIKKINGKNYHWLLFKTSSQHPKPITLQHYDFQTDTEIKDLIEGFFRLRKQNKSFILMDRQANFGHKLFDFFKNDEQGVYYYTCWNTAADKEKFRKNFRSCKIKAHTPHNIHERKIINGSFVIEITNDFHNVNCKETTWTIILTYDPLDKIEIDKKLLTFKRAI